MSQYNVGTVSVTNGSPIVTGVSTSWLAEVNVGDIFSIVGSAVWYEVGSIDSDLQITLASNYAGATQSGLSYVITRDFTPQLGLPYATNGDLETAAIFKRALMLLDSGITVASLNHRGNWLTTTTYAINDAVHSGGRYFVSIVNGNLNNIPPSTGTGDAFWSLVSDRGQPGAGGGGDMYAITYDPTSVAGDAFSMDNMVEGASTKIMTGTERSKLAGIEASATGDQTGAEIKVLYEAEANTNAFTDALLSKLNGVEAAADVTDSVNVDAAGAVMNSDTSTAGMGFVIDEDTMASNMATKVPTQQSVKAYVDTQLLNSAAYQTSYDAATNTPDLDTAPSGIYKGFMYEVSNAGNFFTIPVEVGDLLIATITNPTTINHWAIVSRRLSGASIKSLYEAEANTNAFTDAQVTKLAGIADNANNYSHPATHSADMIVDGTTNKAFTATEKTKLGNISAGSTNPVMDGTAAPGSSLTYSRSDHVHPSDTNRVSCGHLEIDAAAGSYVGSPAGTGVTVYWSAAEFDNSTFDIEITSDLVNGFKNDILIIVPNLDPKPFIIDNHNLSSSPYTLSIKVDNGDAGNTPVVVPSGTRALLYSNGNHCEALTVASFGHLFIDATAGAYVGSPAGTAVEVLLTADEFNNTSFDIEVLQNLGVGFFNDVTILVPDNQPRIFMVDNENLASNPYVLRVRNNNITDPVGVVVPNASRCIIYTNGLHVEDLTVAYLNTAVSFTTVNGRDVATDGAKLDTIESGADVTDPANVAAAGAVMASDTSTAAMQFVIDEDTMASNSATKVPTQQSVKAYVDNIIVSSVVHKGSYNAATNTPDLDVNPVGVLVGHMYTVSVAGTFYTTNLEVGDALIADVDDPASASDWTIVQKNLDAQSILAAILTVDGSGSTLDADLLDSLESTQFLRADVDDVVAGQLTFASAIGNRPILQGGFISSLSGDAIDVDIWGISETYYPSHATAANCWGIRWNSTTNSVEFVGQGSVKMAVDLDLAGLITIDNANLTGVPTTPTAAVDTNTTQIASTSFVVNQAGSASPIMDGTATVGTSTRFARQDHIHPFDTSRHPAGHLFLDVSTGVFDNGGTPLVYDLSATQFEVGSIDLEITTNPGVGIANDITFRVPNGSKRIFIVDNENLGSNPYKIYFKVNNTNPSNTPVMIPNGSRFLIYSNGDHVEGISAATQGHITYDVSTGVFDNGGTPFEYIVPSLEFNNQTFDLEVITAPTGIKNNITFAVPDGHPKIFVIDNENPTANAYNIYVRNYNAGDPTGILVPNMSRFLLYSDGTHVESLSAVYEGGTQAVMSFNGRQGDVIPSAGDYSAADVGALPIAGGAGSPMTGPLYSAMTSPGININLNSATQNMIYWNTAGVAAPTFNTRSIGTKVVLYPGVSSTTQDFALGIEGSHMWFSTYQNLAAHGFKWYGGITEIAKLNGVGDLNLAGKLSVGTTDTVSHMTVEGTALTVGSARHVAHFVDDTALAAGVGAGITLGGVFSGTTKTAFGAIWVEKENATSGNYAGTLHLGTRAHAGVISKDISIDSAGHVTVNQNLGIGVAGPTLRLQVGGATVDATNVIELGKTATAAESNLPRIFQSSILAPGSGNDLVLAARSTSGGVVIQTVSTNRVYIDKNGQFGINTAPSRLVDIKQITDSATGGFRITDSSVTLGLHLWATSTVSHIASNASGSSTLAINEGGGVVVVGSNADLGYGMFQVNGKALVNNDLKVQGKTYTQPSTTASYRCLASSYLGGPTNTGTLKLDLGHTWINQMVIYKIRGYDYSTFGYWEVVISGYCYAGGGGTWANNTRAQIKGKCPFSSIRLAHDGTNCCVLLGTTSQVWNYATVEFIEAMAGYSNGNTLSTVTQGFSVLTAETGITNIYSPPIEILWSNLNDGAGSGLDADTLDGYHADQNANAYTIVQRDANGYIHNTFFNTSGAANNAAAVNYFFDSGSGYIYKKALSNVKTEIVTSAAVTAGLGYTPVDKAGDTMTGTLDLATGASGGLSIESGKHWLTTNDGTGNFNLRVANKMGASFEECTEAGYAFHMEFSQSTGQWQFNISTTSLTTGQQVTWGQRFLIDPTGIIVNGNIVVSGTVDGRDLATDGAKLDGIEAGATADQTAAEILTAIKTVDGSGSGLDADLLDGFHSSTSATGDTIVQRNASGHIYVGIVNSNGVTQTQAAANYFFDDGNGWMYKKPLANVKTEIVTSAAVTSGLGYTPANIAGATFTGPIEINHTNGHLRLKESDAADPADYWLLEKNADNFMIWFRDASLATWHKGFQIVPKGSVSLFHDGVEKFETIGDGVNALDNLGVNTTLPKRVSTWNGTHRTINLYDAANTVRLVAQGSGACLDLVNLTGAADDKWMNLISTGGITKFGSLSDNGAAWVQQHILVMDHGTGFVGFGIAPTVQLHVKASTTQTAIFDTSNANGPYISFQKQGATAGYFGSSAAIGGGGFAGLDLWAIAGQGVRLIPNATLASAITIDTAGSITIGSNNAYLYGKETGGTARALIGIDSANHILVGNAGSDYVHYSTGLEHRWLKGGVQKMVLDANGHLALGIAAGDGTCHIHTATAGAVTANVAADELVLENSTSAGMTILTPDADISRVVFGSPTNNFGAYVSWQYGVGGAVQDFVIGTTVAGGALVFKTGADVQALVLDSSGKLTMDKGAVIGNATLTADFQNDLNLFSNTAATAAQAGAFHNKLKIWGGSGQTRTLELYQVDTGNATIDSSWTGNHLDIKSFAQVNFNQPITTTSTVDGRDLATDGAKLDGIEAGATADQTASEILTAIKTVDGAGSGLDADVLDGYAPSSSATANTIALRNASGYLFAAYFNMTAADQNTTAGSYCYFNTTDGYLRRKSLANVQAEIVTSAAVDTAGAVMNSDTSTAGMSFVIDEDTMASNSATKVPTQQSVKAYVDANSGTPAAPTSGTTYKLASIQYNVHVNSTTSWEQAGRDVVVRVAGTVTVALYHQGNYTPYRSYARVLKNGTQVTSWVTTSGPGYYARTVNVTVAVGDVLTVEHYAETGGSPTYSSMLKWALVYSGTDTYGAVI